MCQFESGESLLSFLRCRTGRGPKQKKRKRIDIIPPIVERQVSMRKEGALSKNSRSFKERFLDHSMLG